MVDIASSLPSLFSASNRLFSKHPDAAWIDASSTSLKLYNLIFGLRPDSQEILLGYKKRGMHCGLWNGFGGKVEPGESAEGAAIREFWEESGLLVQPGNLKHVGVIFNASQGRAVNTYIDVFVVNEDQCEGQPKETVSLSLLSFVMCAAYESIHPDCDRRRCDRLGTVTKSCWSLSIVRQGLIHLSLRNFFQLQYSQN